jgi:hypothetical protein
MPLREDIWNLVSQIGPGAVFFVGIILLTDPSQRRAGKTFGNN